jgi:hypothetical protein
MRLDALRVGLTPGRQSTVCNAQRALSFPSDIPVGPYCGVCPNVIPAAPQAAAFTSQTNLLEMLWHWPAASTAHQVLVLERGTP